MFKWSISCGVLYFFSLLRDKSIGNKLLLSLCPFPLPAHTHAHDFRPARLDPWIFYTVYDGRGRTGVSFSTKKRLWCNHGVLYTFELSVFLECVYPQIPEKLLKIDNLGFSTLRISYSHNLSRSTNTSVPKRAYSIEVRSEKSIAVDLRPETSYVCRRN